MKIFLCTCLDMETGRFMDNKNKISLISVTFSYTESWNTWILQSSIGSSVELPERAILRVLAGAQEGNESKGWTLRFKKYAPFFPWKLCTSKNNPTRFYSFIHLLQNIWGSIWGRRPMRRRDLSPQAFLQTLPRLPIHADWGKKTQQNDCRWQKKRSKFCTRALKMTSNNIFYRSFFIALKTYFMRWGRKKLSHWHPSTPTTLHF